MAFPEQQLGDFGPWFQAIFEDAPIGMLIIGRDQRILRANRAMCAFLGYTEAELQALPFQSLTHPEDLALDEAAAGARLRSGTARSELEMRYKRKDGQVVWGNLHGSMVSDARGAFIVQIEDITERKAAETEWEATHQSLREVLERITDGFFALDRTWRITYTNEAAGRLVQESRDTYLGANFWETFPMIRGTAIDDTFHGAMATGVATTFEYFHAPLAAWFESRVYPSPGGLSIFFRDITEQKQAEVGMAELVHQLSESNRHLAQSSAAKSEFVSTISHELRTPLTSIQGYSELIEREVDTLAVAQAFARIINQNAIRLGRMIGDVLDLDRMEAGQVQLRLSCVDLNRVAERVLDALRPATQRHRLVATLDPAVPCVPGDADLLERVFTNVVANAIKYSPAGGTVTLATDRRGADVEVTVADQGLGVPPDDRETIFARYGRIARPEQIGIEGTGLGLPIARHILEIHNGRIWVEPNTPVGSVFHVVLPAADSMPCPPHAHQSGRDRERA